ncbi:MAG TPA: PAS domain S-box protein [Casimicrobiaceae bacterium]|nr:PAS domain S-box protein [Casimicrobiaceae bacterium]
MTIVAIRRTTRIDERDRLAGEMHDLYQSAPCGFHSANAEGVLVRINDTELGWLGYARDEVVGRLTFASLVAPRQRKAVTRAWTVLRERGSVHDIETELRRKDGTVFPVLLNAVAVTDVGGRFAQSRATVFDITRRRRAEDEAHRYAARLKAMSRRAVEVQEAERRQLARELHDRVGQTLTALNINLNIVKGRAAAASDPVLVARLDDSLELVEATFEKIRDVMAELRPAVLDDYGLAAALRWYADQWGRRTGIAATVVGSDPQPRLAVALEETLFRCVQEALTNVARHARARRVVIALESSARSFSTSVSDDGVGFEASPPAGLAHGSGFGLMFMRERVESAGGLLRIESSAGQGTRIAVEMRSQA